MPLEDTPMTAVTDSDVVTGGCLCGAVRYRLQPPLRSVIACHCRQCRRTSGNYVSATAVPREKFALSNDDGLKWYRSSNSARRGFCSECGSSLFWDHDARDTMTIMSGTIDGNTGLTTVAHICVADKGDYYALNPSEPQYDALDFPSPTESKPIDG